MFKPNVTVACVVQAKGQFLLVEEIIKGKLTLNQPAGHLEANETLIAAVQRELFEETGLDAAPQFFLGLHQWQAPDQTSFLRFSFVIDLPDIVPTFPQDSDISGCRWLPNRSLAPANCAPRWWRKAFVCISKARVIRWIYWVITISRTE